MLAVGLHQVHVSVNAHWDDHQNREVEFDRLKNFLAAN